MTSHAHNLPWKMTPYAIFDMDGTLLDSMSMWDNVDYELLKRRGLTPETGVTEVTKTMTVSESAAYLVDAYNMTDAVEDLIAEINEIANQGYANTIPAKEKAVDFLEWLKMRGTTMCIATSSEPEQAATALRRLGMDGYFEFILSATEVGCGKSRPDVFLEAARRMGAAPEQCTVFEDALHAMATAKKAGFQVVGVYDHTGKDSVAEAYKVSDCFIDHMGQLME